MSPLSRSFYGSNAPVDTPANSRGAIRSVLDILVCAAGEMVRDGRMKLVDGVPVFSDEVNQMLARREAQRHARCTSDDPCQKGKAKAQQLSFAKRKQGQ